MTLLFSGSSECWILIEFDHLLDDLVLRPIEMGVIFELSGVVPAFLRGPLLFIVLKVSFKFTIVLADDPLRWVIEAISDIVGALGYILGAVDVIANQCLSIWSQTLQLLRVESTVLYRAVVPLLVFELQVTVIELDFLAIPFKADNHL